MVRKRMEDKLKINSWEEVDLTLKEIGENEMSIEELEIEMNKKISDLKLEYQDKIDPLKEGIKDLESDVKKFVEQNRGELGEKKSRETTFGKVGFQLSSRVKISRDKEKQAEVLKLIKAKGWDDCYKVDEKIDRNQLKKKSAEEVASVGATKVTKDTFFYEVAREKVESA